MLNTKPDNREAIKKELDQLDIHHVPVEGIILKPSQCYHVETNPLHVLFNTNCPSALKTEVINIIKKYYPDYEDRSSQNG